MALGPGGNHINVVILFNSVKSLILVKTFPSKHSLQNQCFRSKNTVNILIKNMLAAFIGGIAYWATGWELAFGEGKVGHF